MSISAFFLHQEMKKLVMYQLVMIQTNEQAKNYRSNNSLVYIPQHYMMFEFILNSTDD